MNIKNSIATFQLVGSRISKLNVTNDLVNLPSSRRIKQKVDVAYKISNVELEEETYSGLLQLNISVDIKVHFDEESEMPNKCKFSLIIEGCFEGKGMQEEEFKNMLRINGSASLYSIARGFIISTSAQVFSLGKIIIPLLNFHKFTEAKD